MAARQLFFPHRVQVVGHFTSIYSWSYSMKFHFYYLYGWRNIQKTKLQDSATQGNEKKKSQMDHIMIIPFISLPMFWDVSFLSFERRGILLKVIQIFSFRICPLWHMAGYPCEGTMVLGILPFFPTPPCIL